MLARKQLQIALLSLTLLLILTFSLTACIKDTSQLSGTSADQSTTQENDWDWDGDWGGGWDDWGWDDWGWEPTPTPTRP